MRQPQFGRQIARFCFLVANEGDGLVVEGIREVTPVVGHGGGVAEQVPFPVLLPAVGKAEEEVEPAPVRQVVLRIDAVVPLANQRGGVARVTEVIAEAPR